MTGVRSRLARARRPARSPRRQFRPGVAADAPDLKLEGRFLANASLLRDTTIGARRVATWNGVADNPSALDVLNSTSSMPTANPFAVTGGLVTTLVSDGANPTAPTRALTISGSHLHQYAGKVGNPAIGPQVENLNSRLASGGSAAPGAGPELLFYNVVNDTAAGYPTWSPAVNLKGTLDIAFTFPPPTQAFNAATFTLRVQAGFGMMATDVLFARNVGTDLVVNWTGLNGSGVRVPMSQTYFGFFAPDNTSLHSTVISYDFVTNEKVETIAYQSSLQSGFTGNVATAAMQSKLEWHLNETIA